MAKKDNKQDLGKNLTIDLLKLCELNQVPGSLQPPRRGDAFPPGVMRDFAIIIERLGWNAPANWFVATPPDRHFRYERPVVEVPRAPQVGTPSVVQLQFTAGRNQTIMFKQIETQPTNITGMVFGETLFADGVRISETLRGDIEPRLGVERQPGQFVKPQSWVKEDTGSLIIIFRNNDTLSVARFCVEIEGWIIP